MADAQERLRYPVGRFQAPDVITTEVRDGWRDELAGLPAQLRAAAAALTPAQLDTPYRPGGWTARQVIHHLPDSHINAYVRFRWALTEERPLIKVYDEGAWARLPDADSGPIAMSLDLLESVHRRWVAMLEMLDADDFARELVHPESGPTTLDRMVGQYAWHGRHHLAHIDLVLGSNHGS